MYAPIIRNSPCAMLMMPISPYVIARPSAASSRTDPRLKPVNAESPISVVNRRRLISASDSCAAVRTRSSASGYEPSLLRVTRADSTCRTWGSLLFASAAAALALSSGSAFFNASEAADSSRTTLTSAAPRRSPSARESAVRMSATRGSCDAVSLRIASMRTSGSSSASCSTCAGSMAAHAGAVSTARTKARKRRGWNMDVQRGGASGLRSRERRSLRYCRIRRDCPASCRCRR